MQGAVKGINMKSFIDFIVLLLVLSSLVIIENQAMPTMKVALLVMGLSLLGTLILFFIDQKLKT